MKIIAGYIGRNKDFKIIEIKRDKKGRSWLGLRIKKDSRKGEE